MRGFKHLRYFLLRITVVSLLCAGMVRVSAQPPDLSKISSRADKVNSLMGYCDVLRLNATGDKDNFIKLQRASEDGLALLEPGQYTDQAKFLFYRALGNYYQQKFDSAQIFFFKSLAAARQGHSTQQITKACVALVQASFQLKEGEKVEECKNILQSIADTTHDVGMVQDIDYALGSYYQQKTYFSTAQDYFIKSLQSREKEVDTTTNVRKKFDYAIQCDLLSKLYLNTDMADKSLGALRQGQRFASISPTVENRLLSSFVEAFTSSDRIDSALIYNQRLEANTKESNSFPSEVISSDLNIAIYYMNKSRYPEALRYLNKAETIVNQVKQPMMTFQAQMLRGRFLQETGKYEQSIPMLTSALVTASQFNKELYGNILKYLALDKKGLGDDKGSLQYYQRYVSILDTLNKEKVSRTFADLETHYQTSEKEQRIQSLHKENQITSLELKETSHQRLLLIVGLAALGIISLLLYFIYRDKEKLNHALNEKNDRLDQLNHSLAAANETKARLFGIIGHDLRSPVGKIVQLLQLQKETPARLSEAAVLQHQDRLKKASENLLGTMEDLLLWSKSQLEHFTPLLVPAKIKKIVDREIAFVQEQFDPGSISIESQIPDDFVHTTDENFLTVIVRNLLQNAIRHGDNEEPVRIGVSEKMLLISNRTNTDMPTNLNEMIGTRRVSSNISGLGLQIAADLAARMNSRLSFRVSDPQHLEAVLEWSTETA